MRSRVPGALSSFRNYLAYERNYSERTVEAYMRDVNRFFEVVYPGESPDQVLGSVRPREVRMWVLEEMKGMAASSSMNRRLSALQTFFSYARMVGLCSQNPVTHVARPKMPRHLPNFLRTSEMSRLLDEAMFPAGWEGCRDRIMLLLLYSLGVRRAELVSLRWRDVDWRAHAVRVRGKGDRDRLVPMTRELEIELQHFRKACGEQFGASPSDPSPIVVRDDGRALSTDMVYSRVNRYYALSTGGSCRGPHALRHTFATHMLEAGADITAIKELLGHASLASTQIYTHTDVAMLQNAYRAAHPRGKHQVEQVIDRKS